MTNDVVGVTIAVDGVVVGGVLAAGGGSASVTAVYVSTGAAVAAEDDDAKCAVVPPSSTKDKDAYVGASVAFEGACVGTFADSAGKSAAARATVALCGAAAL